MDLKSFNEFTMSHTTRQKNQFVGEIELNGEKYTKEIDHKKKEKNAFKLKPIKYILKHSKSYDKEELLSYDLADVLIIEKEIKESKNSVMKKLFSFFGTQTN
jgi:CMP-N-acetylneuraminic acid synthetase